MQMGKTEASDDRHTAGKMRHKAGETSMQAAEDEARDSQGQGW
jgi:hypothetical protein